MPLGPRPRSVVNFDGFRVYTISRRKSPRPFRVPRRGLGLRVPSVGLRCQDALQSSAPYQAVFRVHCGGGNVGGVRPLCPPVPQIPTRTDGRGGQTSHRICGGPSESSYPSAKGRLAVLVVNVCALALCRSIPPNATTTSAKLVQHRALVKRSLEQRHRPYCA